MLRLASQNLKSRTILLIERDEVCAGEMMAAVKAAGGQLAGCVSSGMGAVAFARRQRIDCVMVHTQTLLRISFPLNEVMASPGVVVVPVTSFDEWYDLDDEEDEEQPLELFLAACA